MSSYPCACSILSEGVQVGVQVKTRVYTAIMVPVSDYDNNETIIKKTRYGWVLFDWHEKNDNSNLKALNFASINTVWLFQKYFSSYYLIKPFAVSCTANDERERDVILSLVIKDIFFGLLFKCVGNIYGTIKLKQIIHLLQ